MSATATAADIGTNTGTINLSKVRSILCVPGHELDRRLDKARASGADLLLFDLEDGVPGPGKAKARTLVERLVKPGDLVRINHPSTAEFEEDIACLSGLHCSLVMVPKVESVGDLISTYEAFGRQGDSPLMMAAIESPVGIYALPSILAGWSSLAGLAFGRWDFMAHCGIADSWSPLVDHAMAQISLGAKAYGLHLSDAPCYSLHDDGLIIWEVDRAKSFGFNSKGCVHPAQVPYCRRLGASEEEVKWASRVMRARPEDGCTGDLLVGPPMRKLAQAILAEKEVPL